MEHEITWGGDPEDVYVTISGVATVEGLDIWVQELLADPGFRPGLRVLVDERRLDWSQMHSEDIERRVDLIAKDTARFGDAYAAMVVGTQVDYGVTRIEQAHVDSRPELRPRLRVFLSVEEAREWLRERAAAETRPADS